MPPPTTVQTFIQALRTGETNTTRAFDAIFTPPYAGRPWLADIRVSGAFNGTTLAGWAVSALQAEGLAQAQIDHVGTWPDADKERVRAFVVSAIEANRRVRFFWGLGHRPVPVTETHDETPDWSVWFLTPQSAVRQLAADDIDVQISPPTGA